MKKNESIVSHWSVLIDNFQASGQYFYETIAENVYQRRVPGVTFTRIEFKERGAFSDRREYLRIQHDDLIFDVGASPYGTGFFFSWWLVRSGARFPWLYPLGFLVVFSVFIALLTTLIGLIAGSVLALILSVAALIALGKTDVIGPEEHIASAPLIGWLYRALANPVTYHSLDLVSMYQESIRRAVNDAVDTILKQQIRAALTPEQRTLDFDTLSGKGSVAAPGR